jgi:quercetin dioxygenase-like cupin family protein
MGLKSHNFKRRREMAVSKLVPIVRQDGEGEQLWFHGGGVHTWKATSAETGGVFILFEDVMTSGKMTPLHTHPGADETMIMLDGEVLLHIEGEELRLGTRGVAVVPRGVPHAFLVISETATMLCLETPGGSEAFYRGASVPATREILDASPVDFARIRESAQRNGGIEILGPPPFAMK